ncbi:MAG: hypothetical protein Q4D60_05095 [Eubacteriales bacterium]|nr:hypothetical protein [Eubacteriales bacterium]
MNQMSLFDTGTKSSDKCDTETAKVTELGKLLSVTMYGPYSYFDDEFYYDLGDRAVRDAGRSVLAKIPYIRQDYYPISLIKFMQRNYNWKSRPACGIKVLEGLESNSCFIKLILYLGEPSRKKVIGIENCFKLNEHYQVMLSSFLNSFKDSKILVWSVPRADMSCVVTKEEMLDFGFHVEKESVKEDGRVVLVKEPEIYAL